MRPVIILHGGAGSPPTNHRKKKLLSKMLDCAKLGFARLDKRGALDAVEAAVECMELSGLFNAGVGAYPNSRGELELDAGLMEGSELRAGAVASVKNVPTPVKLARVVLEETPHVIIVGEAAERLAESKGLRSPLRPKPDRLAKLRELTKGGPTNKPVGTVGAVAVDASGCLASATSTGGLIGKMPGRVGDSPVPGAGYYADNELGAASATGIGEKILVYQLSARVVNHLDRLGAQESAVEAIESMTRRLGPDTAGVIVVDSGGGIGVYMNTRAMPVAVVGDGFETALLLTRETIKKELERLQKVLR